MEKTLYFHGMSTDGYRFTIAGQYQSTNELNLGIAICNPTDQFERKQGRELAENRVENGKKGFHHLIMNGITNIEGNEINTFRNLGKIFDLYSFRDLKKYFEL